MQVIRRDLYERALEAAQYQALVEVKAKVVQGVWRKRVSRRQCDLLRAARDSRHARDSHLRLSLQRDRAARERAHTIALARHTGEILRDRNEG